MTAVTTMLNGHEVAMLYLASGSWALIVDDERVSATFADPAACAYAVAADKLGLCEWLWACRDGIGLPLTVDDIHIPPPS